MTAPNTTHGGLAWLLDNLIERIPETLHAIVLSEDGLLVGSSERLAQDDAEQLAAISSGVHSLALGTSRHFGGARLAVLATSQVDVGNVGYEMTMVVRQVGQFLSAAPRFPEYSGVPFAGEHE